MAETLHIYGTIGYDWWDDSGITAESFNRQMDAAEASDDPDIHIRINSPGGDVYEGVAIYNRIARSTKNTVCFIDGVAASMGGIIALSGKKTIAANNSTILIHNVSGGAWGNSKNLRGTLETMEKLDKSLATVFSAKTGLTEDEVLAKWMDYQDHTLTAQEALDAKLIDEVQNYKAEKVPDNISAMKYDDVMAWFRNEYSAKQPGFITKLKNLFAGKDTAGLDNVNNNIISDMKIKFLAKWAALSATMGITVTEGKSEEEVEITADHLEKVEAKITAQTAELQTATADRDKFKGELDTAIADRDKFKAEAEKFGGKAAEKADETNKEGNEGDKKGFDTSKIKNFGHNKFLEEACGETW